MAIRIDGTNTTANPGITGADADTGLQFGTNELKLVTGGTEAVTVDSSQNVGIGTTSPAVDLDVSGKTRASTGILFGTDTADANTLDDYEEGTWTPTFVNGTWTYGTLQSGRYTKIGSMVYITGTIVWTGKSGTGDLQINLPFTSLGTVSGDRYVGSFGYVAGVDIASPEKPFINTVSGNRTTLGMFVLVDNATPVTTKVQNASTAGELQFSITIMVP